MAPIQADRWYVRDPLLVPVSRRDRFLFCHGDAVSTMDGLDGPAVSAGLELLTGPTRGSDVPAAAAEAIGALVDHGAVLEASEPEPLEAARDRVLTENQGFHFRAHAEHPRCDRLVLAMTGTVISGVMAPAVLSLAYSGFHRELDLIFTEASRRFVQPELFEYYGIRTWTDPFTRRPGMPVPHIVLAKSIDLLAVMPATAACIDRLARGACDDLVSLVAVATTAPVIVAPTMNTAMWDNVAVRRNIDRLRADGVYVVEPTFFFEAAELVHGVPPACGMLGTFWAGPSGLMQVLSAVLDDHAGSDGPGA